MSVRSASREATHRKIVEVASRRFRELGLGGASVARIMADAGLTHGGFYAHFPSKTELVLQALRAAFTTNRHRWLGGLENVDDATWLRRITRRYLNAAHRDTVADGCPVPALAAELAREQPRVRAAFEEELRETLRRVEERLVRTHGAAARDRALALTALLVGAVLLSRSVDDRSLSEQVLEASYDLAMRAFGPRDGG